MARKFIIAVNKEDYKGHKENPLVGRIILGNVSFHRDLLGENDVCFGGGMFKIDEDNKTLYLNDESVDFGVPRWDEDYGRLTIDSDFKGWKIIYEYNKFWYDDKEDVDVTKLITDYV